MNKHHKIMYYKNGCLHITCDKNNTCGKKRVGNSIFCKTHKLAYKSIVSDYKICDGYKYFKEHVASWNIVHDMIPKYYVRCRSYSITCLFLRLYAGWKYMINDKDFINMVLLEDFYSLAYKENYMHSNPVPMLVWKNLMGSIKNMCAHKTLKKYVSCKHCNYILYKVIERIKLWFPSTLCKIIIAYSKPTFFLTN